MPKLAQILAETAILAVEKYDLTVTYRPGATTPEEQDRALELAENSREGAAMAKALSTLLVEWDLYDDEGEVYPVTEEALRQLPNQFLADVFRSVLETQRPNATKSAKSGGSF